MGDTFSNAASIYFDYNFPVVTNTATTAIQLLGTPDLDFSEHFTLYPNPATSTLNIKTKDATSISSAGIYDMAGRLLMTVTDVTRGIDLSNLASGNYLVKVLTPKGNAVAKFVKA